MLPSIPPPTATVDLDGTNKVEVRGLCRAAALRMRTFGEDYDAAEVFLISEGCGVSLEEAKAWHEQSSVEAVGKVVDTIVEISGLGEEVSKSDGTRPVDEGD